MIYTINQAEFDRFKVAQPSLWIDVKCPMDIDLDLADTAMGLQPCGIRTDCDHSWWDQECVRGRLADYMFLAGADVQHLGEVVWDHRPYAADRWYKLYPEATIDAWTRRIQRRPR